MSGILPPSLQSGSTRADELVNGEAVAIQSLPSGLFARAFGGLVDAVVYIILTTLLTSTVFRVMQPTGDIVIVIATVTVTVGLIVVPFLVESLTRGRSLGKLIIGGRIVRNDGGAISGRHAWIRALMSIPDRYLTLGALGFLVGIFNPRSQRLGDLLAGTYCMTVRVPKPAPAPFALPAHLEPWAIIADVSKFSDRLAVRVSAFIRNFNSMSPAARVKLTADLERELRAYVVPFPPTGDPLEAVIAISAVRRDRELAKLALKDRQFMSLEPQLQEVPHGMVLRD